MFLSSTNIVIPKFSFFDSSMIMSFFRLILTDFFELANISLDGKQEIRNIHKIVIVVDVFCEIANLRSIGTHPKACCTIGQLISVPKILVSEI